MLSPKSFCIILPDLGPCNCNGETSGSCILTSKPEFTAKPCAQNRMSLSAKEIQNLFSSRRNKTGSFKIPPSAFVTIIYLHCPTANLDKSRGVRS